MDKAMRFGRYGKDDRRWFNPNARAIVSLIAVEIVDLVLAALAFFRGWYSLAFLLLVMGFFVLPLLWLLVPLFWKR